MPPTRIDDPILNSPFAEPSRHFRFDDGGITVEVAVALRQRLLRPEPRVVR